MDNTQSKSVHADESSRAKMSAIAHKRYPELCKDGCEESAIIAVEYGIDLSEAEAEKYAIWHENYSAAETSYIEVNGCFAISRYLRISKVAILATWMVEGFFSKPTLKHFVRETLIGWGFENDEIESFLKKIEVKN